MKQIYDDDCRKIYHTFLEEVTYCQKVLDDQKRNYENSQFADNIQITQTHQSLNEELEKKRIKINSAAINRCDEFKAEVDLKTDKLRTVMQEILHEYHTTTAEPEQLGIFNRMAMNVACFTFKSQSMDEEARKCQLEVTKLQKELNELDLFYNHRIQSLKRERGDILARYWTLNESVKELAASDKSKLGNLATGSINALKVSLPKLTLNHKLIKNTHD